MDLHKFYFHICTVYTRSKAWLCICIKKTICNMMSGASEALLEVSDGLPEVLVP